MRSCTASRPTRRTADRARQGDPQGDTEWRRCEVYLGAKASRRIMLAALVERRERSWGLAQHPSESVRGVTATRFWKQGAYHSGHQS